MDPADEKKVPMIIDEVILPDLCAKLDRELFEVWDPSQGPFLPAFERLGRAGDRAKLERYLVSEMVNSWAGDRTTYDGYRSKHQLVKVLESIWGGPEGSINRWVLSRIADWMIQVRR
jgi:hypothetical protein